MLHCVGLHDIKFASQLASQHFSVLKYYQTNTS